MPTLCLYYVLAQQAKFSLISAAAKLSNQPKTLYFEYQQSLKFGFSFSHEWVNFLLVCRPDNIAIRGMFYTREKVIYYSLGRYIKAFSKLNKKSNCSGLVKLMKNDTVL